MDAIELIREMYEDEDEEVRPSRRSKSSESMNPGHHISSPSWPSTMEPSQPSTLDSLGPPPPIDGIKSIKEMYEKMDPIEQIDPLFSFVETQLQKMNSPSEGGSSSSEGWLDTVRDGTKLAAKIIETISGEAEKLSISDALEAIVKGIGELNWVFMSLSVAAFVAESYMRVSSTENDFRELLHKILELAQNVKQHGEQIERRKLCNAVVTIVEGAVICFDHLNRNRFWSKAAVQLEKTNQLLDSLRLSPLQHVLDLQWRKYDEGDKDVFLSHSGKQKEFVRLLHQDLIGKHVSCFFDEADLPVAQKFPDIIFRHAETCKIAVLVLSKDFIRSKWPMLELSAFIRTMNSRKNDKLFLFPIFFMISPKELHITEDIPEWQQLEVSKHERGQWRAALDVVRSINGLQFCENENEVAFRKKAVKEIRRCLKQINQKSHLQLLHFKPVGIEEQARDVKALLEMEGVRSALAVIVCGFGGVGKTTLAAFAVQSLDWSSTDFKFCMVTIDEGRRDKTTHIIELQKNIISVSRTL